MVFDLANEARALTFDIALESARIWIPRGYQHEAGGRCQMIASLSNARFDLPL
jgi:hypothetical protein